MRRYLSSRGPVDATVPEAELDISAHSPPGEDRVRLKDEAARVMRGFDHRSLVDHPAPRRPIQACEDPQQRRLPASGAPEHGNETPLFDLEADVPQGEERAVGVEAPELMPDVLDGDLGAAASCSLTRAPRSSE